MGEYIRNAGTGVRKREGAGGDVFTGNDRNAAEPVPCYASQSQGI